MRLVLLLVVPSALAAAQLERSAGFASLVRLSRFLVCSSIEVCNGTKGHYVISMV